MLITQHTSPPCLLNRIILVSIMACRAVSLKQSGVTAAVRRCSIVPVTRKKAARRRCSDNRISVWSLKDKICLSNVFFCLLFQIVTSISPLSVRLFYERSLERLHRATKREPGFKRIAAFSTISTVYNTVCTSSRLHNNQEMRWLGRQSDNTPRLYL